MSNFEPVDELDDICFGGAVLDLVRNEARIFGTCSVLAVQRHFISLVGQRWPKWRIEWAENEISDLCQAAGVEDLCTEFPSNPLDRDSLIEDAEAAASGYASDEYAELYPLLSVLDGPSVRHVAFNVKEIDDLLSHGPEFVDWVPFLAPVVPREIRTSSGLVLDIRNRHAEFWTADRLNSQFRSIKVDPRWPGWTLQRQRDGFLRQMRVSAAPPDSYVAMTTEEIQAVLADLI